MHTVIVTLKAQPGKGSVILNALAASLPDTRAFAGCQLVETYTDTNDPDTIILWEKWDEQASQVKYLEWRSTQTPSAELGAALAAAPTFVHYTLQPGV